jgi:hypothetical protein
MGPDQRVLVSIFKWSKKPSSFSSASGFGTLSASSTEVQSKPFSRAKAKAIAIAPGGAKFSELRWIMILLEKSSSVEAFRQ